MFTGTAITAVILAFCPSPARSDEVAEKDHWRAIVAGGYAIPAGEDPHALLVRLYQHLGSPDPTLRDAYGYGITVQWVYRDHHLDAAAMTDLVERLLANLDVDIGEQGTDSVLLRSFSALCLSLYAARDLEQPFLDADHLDALLSGALTYLAEERDVRGHDPELGWLHSAAHTADLLKFLARNPRLDRDAQERILAGIAARLDTADEVFTHGEDDRLCRVVLSILARDDYDEELLLDFLTALQVQKRRRAVVDDFDAAAHRARQNGLNLLRALYVALVLEDQTAAHIEAARAAVLQTLKTF